ncbi:helix-turn-helix transcriptional regulator [Candidatus Peregrinibacteria bacterium]|nr:helix-turn-helix transcriptional regulator [Candidatus Peregrinibacteria bacterium]
MKLPKFADEILLALKLKSPPALEEYEKLYIGAQIKKIRRKMGMKQLELARKLKTSQSVIARIENGRQNLTLKTLILIAHVLGKKLFVKFY